jgi:tetratricopeptide (TPR) repeat protein
MLKFVLTAVVIVVADMIAGAAVAEPKDNIRTCAAPFQHTNPEDGSDRNRLAGDYYNRGVAYQGKGDLDCAIKAYSWAIRFGIVDFYPMVYFKRGDAYKDRSEADGTIADLASAMEGGLSNFRKHYDRGNADYAIDDLARSLSDFRVFIELTPEGDPTSKLALSHSDEIENKLAELTPQSPPPSPRGWVIQIAAMSNRASALEMLNRALYAGSMLANAETYTETVLLNSVPHYRARLAGFPGKDKARAACDDLKEKGFGCFVVSSNEISPEISSKPDSEIATHRRAAPIQSQKLSAGLRAYERGDFETAFKLWKRWAEQGDAAAQFNLGFMYDEGHGVERNAAKAVKWYNEAVNQGYAPGQNNLGVMYEDGRGVDRNYLLASWYYSSAAEQGHAIGQNNFGDMYYFGRGVERDFVEAVGWYRAAAKQGQADGLFNLGFMFENGRGVVRDHLEAAKWYGKAAEQGHATAIANLANIHDDDG